MQSAPQALVVYCFCGGTNSGVLRLRLRMTTKNKQRRKTGNGGNEQQRKTTAAKTNKENPPDSWNTHLQIAMEDFVLSVLVLAVLWLFLRTRGRAADRKKLAEHNDLIGRLHQRVLLLEEAARGGTPATQQAGAERAVVRGGPFPADAVVASQASVAPQPASAPFVSAPPADAAPQDIVLPMPSAPYAPAAAAELPTEIPAAHVPVPPPPPKRHVSFEERFGQNWLNKLGIVAVVIGLAGGLGLLMRTIGPAGKSAIGIVLSFAILGGGILLERKPQYRIFARALIGGGWALTFFVTFALYHVDALQVLQSQTVDLVLMLIVAAAMVAHSLKYKSQVVTGLAFLLAFVTVGISHVTMFSLVAGALLAVGLVYVVAREYWFELGLAGLVGVYLNHFVWLHRVLPDGGQPGHPFPEFVSSAALLLFYWLIFRLFYVLRVPKTRRQELVSSFSAILNSVGLLSLLKYQSSHREWAFYGLLTLGVAEFVFAFVARRRWRGAFVVLSSIASILLLAAVPFRFSGAHWTLLWLLEAEVLFIAGLRLKEVVFRRLGVIAGFVTTAQLLVAGVAPLVDFRQAHVDTTHHLHLAITLFSAAVLFWVNSEFCTRRWDFIVADEIDRAGLVFTSYMALGVAALALWVFFPGAWTIVAWLVAVLVLAWFADRLSSRDLATQADILAASAIIRAATVNLFVHDPWHGLSLRAITVALSGVLLYVAMRRKTRAHGIVADYIAPAYSWAAAALIGTLLWYELEPIAVAVAWGVFGLLLFEVGTMLRRNYLRHQGYALLAASFVRLWFSNLNVGDASHFLSPRLYTILPLIAAYFWVYQRLHAEEQHAEFQVSSFERNAGVVAAWFGTVAASVLLYFEVRPDWVGIAWAVFALVLIALGWWLQRTLFVAQSLVLLIAAAIRELMFHLFSPEPLATAFTSSRVFCVGAACALMLVALPLAFRVRSQLAPQAAAKSDWRRYTLFRPEQSFFFTPLVLLAVLLFLQLHAGMITMGWVVLGLLAFLFALTVGERSYRLAGLALLMLGVGKIVVYDIWRVSLTDRFLTLIVMGVALLLVSFLYSRYKETILKFL